MSSRSNSLPSPSNPRAALGIAGPPLNSGAILGLDSFWREALAQDAGDVPWEKVIELLAVNRLIAPRSELSIHEKWFPQTAMDLLLDTDARVAGKDRLYRCLDRITAHKPALEEHLAQKWKDLFGATFDLLLYDLTSTYFEGDVEAVPKARRGYSRDHRPDCKQLVLALVVTPEGFALSYELFAGNRLDRTTLEHILDTIEKKFGKARRLWVFDRGIVSEENLQLLRERGAHYLVGTPRSQLKAYEEPLLTGDWQKVSEPVQGQLIPESEEVYVLCRSAGRVLKERAMRQRWLRKLIGDLRKLRQRVQDGRLKEREGIQRAIGRLQERHPQAWRWLQWELTETEAGLALAWDWDREKFKQSKQAEGGVSPARPLDGAGPGQALENLHAVDRGGGGLPHLEERGESASHLALDGATSRGPCAGGVLGLLPVGLFEKESPTRRAQPDPVADPRSTRAHRAGRSVV